MEIKSNETYDLNWNFHSSLQLQKTITQNQKGNKSHHNTHTNAIETTVFKQMLINKDPSETLSNCRQKDGQWEMPLSDRNYRNEQRDRGSFYHAKENTCDQTTIPHAEQMHFLSCLFYWYIRWHKSTSIMTDKTLLIAFLIIQRYEWFID